MELQTNQKGVSRVLLIAGIIVLGLLVLTAVFFMFKKPNQPKSNQSSDPYLTITEWGVRFPLPLGNRDMYYKLVKYQGGIGEGVRIYSKDFNDLKNAKGAACGDESYPLMVISRVSRLRGAQMNNPDMPNYDPKSGPYKTYLFQTDYAFGPSKDSKTVPPCVNLNFGTGQAFSRDQAAYDTWQKKQSALTSGYAELQAVPTPEEQKEK